MPFSDARDFARTLGLESMQDWSSYCREEFPHLPPKPDNIPKKPQVTYKYLGWSGYPDFLNFPSRSGRFRYFVLAREFVQTLGLLTIAEWRDYCRGDLAETRGIKPRDIPSSPERIYSENGWISWSDWLGTELIYRGDGQYYLTFADARDRARKMGFTYKREWFALFDSDGFPKLGTPEDLPKYPDKIYKGNGWRGWNDWLYNPRYRIKNKTWREFNQAREFARGLKLNSNKAWRDYTRGDGILFGELPDDIPSNPDIAYKNSGWISWGDWLNTGRVAPSRRTFLPFEKAREFSRQLNFKNLYVWRNYCTGDIEGLDPIPDTIPTNPDRTYKKEWKGWGDWLGTGNIANYNKDFLSYKEAKKFVHALKLRSSLEWRRYCQGKYPSKPKRPDNIPTSPEKTYKNHWKGWPDWCCGRKEQLPKYSPFEKARSFVRKLGLKTTKEWKFYTQGKSRKKKPDNIPARPDLTYKSEWKGMPDWLGTASEALRRHS